MRLRGTLGSFLLAFLVCMVATAADQLEMGNSLGKPTPNMSLRLMPPQIGIAGDPVLGAATAPVTVVEFSDYECPYCQAFSQKVFPQLKARYIDTGKIRYVARDFPLARHARARPAAIAAACAGAQAQFWPMHDALLSEGRLTDGDIERYAQTLKLDAAAFTACRAEESHQPRLDKDYATARGAGVGATPSFLIGASRGDLAQGKVFAGLETFEDFERALANYLPPESSTH